MDQCRRAANDRFAAAIGWSRPLVTTAGV